MAEAIPGRESRRQFADQSEPDKDRNQREKRSAEHDLPDGKRTAAFESAHNLDRSPHAGKRESGGELEENADQRALRIAGSRGSQITDLGSKTTGGGMALRSTLRLSSWPANGLAQPIILLAKNLAQQTVRVRKPFRAAKRAIRRPLFRCVQRKARSFSSVESPS